MHGVAAEIHQRAAAQRRIMPQLSGPVFDGHREFGLDRTELAECAAADGRENVLEHRMEAVVEGLHQRPARARGRLRHRACLTRVHRERLLAQDRLSGLQRRDGKARMQMRGQGVIDQVDVRMRDQRVIASKALGNAMLGGVGACPLAVPRRHADDRAILPLACRRNQRGRRNLRSAENADPDHASS